MQIPTTGMRIPGPAGPDTLELGKYHGGGAFGAVFEATEIATGEKFAVKFPQTAVFGGQAELDAFLNEVTAAIEIHHPNVVRVVYVETNHPSLPPFLIMEFLSDGTLKSQLDALRAAQSQIGAGAFRELALGLIDGIEAINEKMLHRDLKPDNILMDGSTPKIGDFGLAKVVGAATRTHTFKGGQHMLYMAPEGWRLETNAIQLDMYAMGIVLYEIATLKFPYQLPADPRDIEGLKRMHLFQAVKPLALLRPDLPPEYSQVVTRLMEKRAEDRFRSWDEARTAIEKGARPAADSGRVKQLLGLTEQLHSEAEQRRLAEAEKQAQLEERRELNAVMDQKLRDVFQEVVDQFNASSSLGRIQTSWSSQGGIISRRLYAHQITLPFGASIQYKAINVQPPMHLKVGQVEYAVTLKLGMGAGAHFLLCRTNDADLYGKWIVCRVDMGWGANDPRQWGNRLPFDNNEDFHHIERADRAMHVYNVSFYESDRIQETFLDLIEHAMKNRKQPQQ